MNNFNDIVSSIGAKGPITQPVRPSSTKPLATAALSTNVSKSAPPTPSAGPQTKPTYKGTAGTPVASQQGVGLKRKAEEPASERAKSSKPVASETKPPTPSKSKNGSSANQKTQDVSKPATKVPYKGSYAEIMARAKADAQSKTPSQIGVIKHQATEKTKVSKLADRRRADQDKGKPGLNGRTDSRRRSASPVKSTKTANSSAPRIPKVPQPPLHGPNRPQAPAYSGTMGQTSKRSREDIRKKQSRRDEYLATDEEDEGDSDDEQGDEGGYHSDASSENMEGNFDDLLFEERETARLAKIDDAREAELEKRLKQEKLARKQKLTALAAKRK